MLNPSKMQAFWYAAIGLGVGFFFILIPISPLMWAAFFYAALYASIGGYKVYRDAMIVASVQSQQDNTQRLVTGPPPKTSKGSGRLFVPPPLDKTP